MRKLIPCIILVITLLIKGVTGVYAQEADASAAIKPKVDGSYFDYRVENLKKYLEKYDSPLAVYSPEFVMYADQNGLDYRLIPAITGVESTFGKNIPFNSYNAYGWANGDYSFKSWQDSISIVSISLRTNYIERGASTISTIARRYAPPSTTWGSKVKYFVGKIDPLPLNFDII